MILLSPSRLSRLTSLCPLSLVGLCSNFFLRHAGKLWARFSAQIWVSQASEPYSVLPTHFLPCRFGIRPVSCSWSCSWSCSLSPLTAHPRLYPHPVLALPTSQSAPSAPFATESNRTARSDRFRIRRQGESILIVIFPRVNAYADADADRAHHPPLSSLLSPRSSLGSYQALKEICRRINLGEAPLSPPSGAATA